LPPWIPESIKYIGVPATMLALALWAGWKKEPTWVFGNYYREALRQRDEEREREVTRLNVDVANMRIERDDWKRIYFELAPTTTKAVARIVEDSKGVRG
jgi:hypothetical protein